MLVLFYDTTIACVNHTRKIAYTIAALLGRNYYNR
jgi:hypothetical protein